MCDGTYTMTFNNFWELMSEDEMYDVSGGWKIFDSAIDKVVKFFADAVIGTLSLTFGVKAAVTIYQGLSLIKGFKDE